MVSFIMKLCLAIGPKTATMFASTHKFTLRFRSMVSSELKTHYDNAKEFNLRDGYTWDEALVAVLKRPCLRCSIKKDIMCDVFLRQVIKVDSRVVFSMKEPTEEDYISACKKYVCKTNEIFCLKPNVFERHPPVLAAISRNAQTERIVEAAVIKYVKKNELPVKTGYGTALEHAHIKTPKICWLAVQDTPASIRFVPKNMRTGEMWDEIAKDGFLHLIPKRNLTQQRIVYAMNPELLCTYYDPFRRIDHVLHHVELWLGPLSVKTWERALTEYPKLYSIVFTNMKKVEFWIAAVALRLAKVGHVPVKFQPLVKMTAYTFK